MNLLDAVPSTPTPFKVICQTLGVPEPTPELREEMKNLLVSGEVVQEGEKRGAKYRRRSEGEATSSPSPAKEMEVETASNTGLLDAIPSTPTPFKVICQTLGVPEPTPELREEMKRLLATGEVIQEGEKRGAKYCRRNAGGAPLSSPVKVSEPPKSAPAAAPVAVPAVEEAPRPAPPPEEKVSWEWVNPAKTTFSNNPELGELHHWILTNWRELAAVPGDVFALGNRIALVQGCPDPDILSICNALADLAQLGEIFVRVDRSKGYKSHLFGWWAENPEF